jgi:hypothetical protein
MAAVTCAVTCAVTASLLTAGTHAGTETEAGVPKCGDTVMVNGIFDGLFLEFKVIGVDLWKWLPPDKPGTLASKSHTFGEPEVQH